MREHTFEDAKKPNPEHPVNQKVYQGTSGLAVGQNRGPAQAAVTIAAL